MRSRRSALTLLVVMIVVAGALSAAERDRTKDKPKTTTTAPAVAAAPAPSAGREVAATLPAGKPVRARVGDTVILHVRSAKPDIASMLELGLQTSVGPALLGELRFIAESSGTFPVMLTVTGTKGGVVEVSAAERQ